MTSSVDAAHGYTEFTLDISISFYKEISSSPAGSKNKPQNSSYVCRDDTRGRKKEGKKEKKKESNKQRKDRRQKRKTHGRKEERKKNEYTNEFVYEDCTDIFESIIVLKFTNC